MMACRGCRCEYVRPVITDEVITGLPRAEQRHTDESFGPAHGVCVDLTMRRSTPPVLWSCLLTGCTHAYGLDWSHHRLPYWAKFHLVLERISRCWDFEGISWSWNCHLFIIYGKVLLLLFSFCFHGLEKNPTFFSRPLRRPFNSPSLCVFVPIHLLPFGVYVLSTCYPHHPICIEICASGESAKHFGGECCSTNLEAYLDGRR
jgi:hypothetical protein